MDIFSDSYDPARDRPREREIESLTPGNPFRVKASDPYGFWSIHRDKGQIPSHLQGSYTSFEKAAQAVEVYMKALRQTETEVKGVEVSQSVGRTAARPVVSTVSGGVSVSRPNNP